MLSEETRIIFKDTTVQEREADLPLTGADEWQAPDANYGERVYYNLTKGKPEVEIVNLQFVSSGTTPVKDSIILSVDTVGTLTKLVQWKMPGAGTHVLGVETSNCWVVGRRNEREKGTLVFIEPGETVKYELRLNIC